MKHRLLIALSALSITMTAGLSLEILAQTNPQSGGITQTETQNQTTQTPGQATLPGQTGTTEATGTTETTATAETTGAVKPCNCKDAQGNPIPCSSQSGNMGTTNLQTPSNTNPNNTGTKSSY